MSDTTDPGIDCLLTDGRIIHLRHTRPDDGQRLLELHARASARSRYLRFFTGGASLEREVDRLLACSDEDHVSLVAEQGDQMIGVASSVRLDDDRADFALLVDDLWQAAGVGTLLLEQLAALARRAGISDLVGDVLPGNTRMLQVGAGVAPGIPRGSDPEAELLQVHVPTHPDEAALAAAALRDRVAERRSLDPLLRPTSVAVIGAGRRPGSVGHEVVASLQEAGFPGPIFPVNPHARQVRGLRAWHSLEALGRGVDLAVVAVPAAAVADVVAQCATAGVRAVVVLTATLTSTTSRERVAEAQLVRSARASGLRVVGPNCLGVVNTDPAVRLAATFAPGRPPAGHLALASQSGAVGVAVLQALAASQLGISTFVSLGNKADVSTNDLLAYWYDDPETSVVALYVESFGNPRRFATLAQALSLRKPVLAVKSGRSAGGRRAGASHTAAAAAPDLVVSGLLEQAGVIRTETLGELMDAARLLTSQPLPAGSRLGIVGNAGGLNVLAADAAETRGLAVPSLTDAVQRALDAPATAAGLTNPVDLGAEASPAALARAIRVLATSGELDALVVTVVGTRANDAAGVLAAVAAASDEQALPVVVVATGTAAGPALGHRSAPVYDLPEQAVQAMAHAARYAGWRRTPHGRPVLAGVDRARARGMVAAALVGGEGWQPADLSRSLLSCYGIQVLPASLAIGSDSAAEAAETLGYPVALKAADPALVHKSDVGAVLLDLADPAAVTDGDTTIATSLRASRPAVLVQPMAPPGLELAAGVLHDPQFGPLVTLRGGGTATDLFPDTSLRLPPLAPSDAAAMWRRLPFAPLLQGHRGRPPADTAALEDLLLRIAQLAEDLPAVAELDLNPVVLTSSAAVLVDVKLRLAAPRSEPDPYVRALAQFRAG